MKAPARFPGPWRVARLENGEKWPFVLTRMIGPMRSETMRNARGKPVQFATERQALDFCPAAIPWGGA